MDIQAAILREPGGQFAIEAATLDAPKTSEVLVKVVAAGVCHTDIGVQHIMPMPVVLGHEGSGLVEARPGGDESCTRGLRRDDLWVMWEMS